MSTPPDDGIYVIPVPDGWSVEQTYEALKHEDPLPASHGSVWVSILIKDGRFTYLNEARS